MAKFNAQNERIKHAYLEWEQEARGKHTSTVDNIRDAIYLFEEHTNFKDFKSVNKLDIIPFKGALKRKKNARTGEPISKKYLLQTSQHLIEFFQWLLSQKGYKKRLSKTDVDYFNLSNKDMHAARATSPKRFPTIEQIEHVVRNMPTNTDVQKRDRALIAFLGLTGCRVKAAASLRLKHVFIEDERIEQDPHEVETKGSKKITTFLFQVSDYLKTIFKEWVRFLEKEKLCDFNAPLFPSTKAAFNDQTHFTAGELDTVPWRSTTAMRDIVKKAFLNAGLPYYNPHSFRHTIAHIGYKRCKGPEEFKAWSQNLGHNNVLTTFTSYGTIDEQRQGEIIKGLNKRL